MGIIREAFSPAECWAIAGCNEMLPLVATLYLCIGGSIPLHWVAELIAFSSYAMDGKSDRGIHWVEEPDTHVLDRLME
jgi:hypothetical protein